MSATRPVRPVVTCTFEPPRALVRLRGEFDLSAREHLADVLECLRLRGCTTVEVDAQQVTFVDASCLRVLHTESVRLRSAGGALRVVAASPVVVRIVEVAGYLHLLPGDQPAVPAPRSEQPEPPEQPELSEGSSRRSRALRAVREETRQPHPSV